MLGEYDTMNLATNPYYTEMLHRGRLIPFFTKDNKMICFITFFITDNLPRFFDADPWEVLNDNPSGENCYISQLFTSKSKDNPKLSYEIWHRFKIYIKQNFNNVRFICWRRWDKKTQAVKIYKKELKCQN